MLNFSFEQVKYGKHAEPDKKVPLGQALIQWPAASTPTPLEPVVIPEFMHAELTRK